MAIKGVRDNLIVILLFKIIISLERICKIQHKYRFNNGANLPGISCC